MNQQVWSTFNWTSAMRDIVLNGREAKLIIAFDGLTGKWYWSMGINGEWSAGFPGHSGTFTADTEDEAVAKAMRLAKKWGATW